MTSEGVVGVDVLESERLSEAQLAELIGLFEQSYSEADPAYIETSARTLRYVALARAEGRLVGFGFGETRLSPLPRMKGPQAVALAGISCVDPTVRQRGLFSQMAMQTLSHGGLIPSDRLFLFRGRMAHALSYRTIRRMTPHCVPAPGKTITDWHQEVLEAVAALFGVEVDPATGRVAGPGRPVGFPRVSFTPTPDERSLFDRVDRSRGDSLLTLAWMPNAPPGWYGTQPS